MLAAVEHDGVQGAVELTVAAAAEAVPERLRRSNRDERPSRLIVFLRYFADLSYAEIASLCDISEGTVAATLSHAHADLLKDLQREEAPR